MGSVAERDEVARPLAYKHFANRDELLRALYLREASSIDRRIRHEVGAAPDGFEPKFRAFVAGVVEHVAGNNAVFSRLRAASADKGFAETQHGWDRRTVRYFGDLAAQDIGLDERDARSAVSMLLGGVQPLLAQLRATPSATKQVELQERYITLVLAALRGLGAGSARR